MEFHDEMEILCVGLLGGARGPGNWKLIFSWEEKVRLKFYVWKSTTADVTGKDENEQSFYLQ